MRRSLVLSALLLSSAATFASPEPLVSEGALRVDEQEFARMLKHALPSRKQESLRQNRASFDKMLEEYTLFRQLELEAARLGLDQDQDLLARLEMHRLTTLATAVIERKLSELPLPDFAAAAAETYQASAEPIMGADQVHARHILIAVNDTTPDEQALVLAQEVRAKLVAKPRSFKALVKEYSDDPAAADNKGDLGFFTAREMVKPFAEAAFALQEKEISQPVRSEFGYHIIQVLKHKKGQPLKLTEALPRLIRAERNAFYQRERQKLIDAYRHSEGLQYDQQRIDEFYQKFVDESR